MEVSDSCDSIRSCLEKRAAEEMATARQNLVNAFGCSLYVHRIQLAGVLVNY